MRTTTLSYPRRWLEASSIALMLALGGTAALVATSQHAVAQSTPIGGVPGGFADLVEAVKPAVVSITVDGETKVRQLGNDFEFDLPDLPENHPLRRFFDQFGNQGRNGNGKGPQTRRFQAAGSGFIISADGFVVTNNHVVENADNVIVVDDNGDEHQARIVGVDERTDLALLKIDDAENLPFVEFAETEVRIGDWVVAVGNPFRLGGTVTAGIVSARGRDISGSAYGDFIQIDAAINRGNSGGPAFNTSGKVIGVNTAIFSPNGGNVGIAFAIPAAVVKQVIFDLMDDGTVTRGYLGVAIQNVNADIAESVGLEHASGALVIEPSEGTPAARAGIKSGDIILEVDGEEIDSSIDLSRTIAGKAPGTAVDLIVWRDGERQTIVVTLDELDDTQLAAAVEDILPDPEPAAPTPTSIGMTLVPNADGDGLLIQEIDPDSIAATKGFAVGDIILEVDNKIVASVAALEEAITTVNDSGRNTVLVKAMRSERVRFIGLPLEAN